MTKARSAAPSARPGGLDNVDGGLERRGYSQTFYFAQALNPGARPESSPALPLHDGDRGGNRLIHVETRRIEFVRIRGGDQRRNAARAVALVAAQDVGEDRGLIGRLTG